MTSRHAATGNLYVGDYVALRKVTPAGVVTEYKLPVHNAPLNDGTDSTGPDDPEPTDIVVGPNGNLWFTETGVNRIGEITPAGLITAASVSVGIAIDARTNRSISTR